MNQRIEIHFTRRDGYRDKDVFGMVGQAISYAKLLDEAGYHIERVLDAYRQKEIDWRGSCNPFPRQG